MNDPKPEEEVCFNCKYIFWGIALGLGLRCRHENNKLVDKTFPLPVIPSRRHTCKNFSFHKNHS